MFTLLIWLVRIGLFVLRRFVFGFGFHCVRLVCWPRVFWFGLFLYLRFGWVCLGVWLVCDCLAGLDLV